MAEWGIDLPSPFAGRYEILRELGRGASAVVYLVHDQPHDRDVALKVLSPDYASALGPARFLREIRLVSRLQHPYIVPVLDSGESGGRLYFVMPLVEGQPLRARMAREGQLPVADAVRYATEIADALQHAHDHGVLHRDVKPENILLSGQHACLADFGIARALTPATGDDITTTGVILGTPAYMSPEQATSEANIDGRSDQYALGCVLFEMLAGVPPFVGPNEQSIIAQRFHHAAPRVSQYRPAVGRMLDDTVARALQMAPADRFSSAGTFAEALRRAMETPSMEAQRAATPVSVARTVRRRWTAGALTALAGGAIAYEVWRSVSASGEALAAINVATLIAEPAPNVSANPAEAYRRARLDFADGHLSRAEAGFERAAALDPGLALASLWHAQLIQWRGDERDGSDWSVPARRAMRNRQNLSPRDAHHALALVALAERQYPDACRAFGQVVEADSLSFVGWFGLGECRRLDSEVVADSASPSRWRFRAELSDAIDAYTESLALAPGEPAAPLFRRAASMFFTEPSRVREGRATSLGGAPFIAYPELIRDTVSFVPFPAEQVGAISRATAPRSRGAALERGRAMELAFVRRWVQLMPANVHALESYSRALESRGDLTDDDPGRADALSAIREARRRNTDARRSIPLQAAEVRLLIKNGQFAHAGRLVDSALAAGPPADGASGLLAALAVLQGDEAETAKHLRSLWTTERGARGEFGAPIPAALASRLALLVAAVENGNCRAMHLDSLERGVEEIIGTIEEPGRRDGISAGLLDDVRARAAICTNGESALNVRRSDNRYIQLVSAAARGDSSTVLGVLSLIDAGRAGWSRSNLSWDTVALECWALASTGAVREAAARLDSSLVGLQFSSNQLTSEIRIAGGFRRSLQLRADLAARLSDTTVAHRWHGALQALAGTAR